MPIRGPSAGGVRAKPNDRIQFDFMLDGVRYRPTIRRTPTTQNLRSARERLAGIRQRIRAGTFHFDQEIPEYRFLGRVGDSRGLSTRAQCTLASANRHPAVPEGRLRDTRAPGGCVVPLQPKNIQQRSQRAPACVRLRLPQPPTSHQPGARPAWVTYVAQGADPARSIPDR